MSSPPVFGLAGSTRSSRKSGSGGLASLSRSTRGDLGRPEELVLEVDESLARHGAREGRTRGCGSRRAGSPCRSARARCARSGARSPPASSIGATGASASPVTSCQRMRKCSATSPTAGPAILAHASCQPTFARAGWSVGVVAVAGFRGEVDTADEGDAIVDHDRLLVVAVQRSFVSSRGAHWIFVSRVSCVAHLPYVAARRAKERQRRPRPGKHPDVEALCQLCKQVTKHERLSVPCQGEIRREVPARQVNVRAGSLAAHQPLQATPARRRSVPRLRSPLASEALRPPTRPPVGRVRVPNRGREGVSDGGGASAA